MNEKSGPVINARRQSVREEMRRKQSKGKKLKKKKSRNSAGSVLICNQNKIKKMNTKRIIN